MVKCVHKKVITIQEADALYTVAFWHWCKDCGALQRDNLRASKPGRWRSPKHKTR